MQKLVFKLFGVLLLVLFPATFLVAQVTDNNNCGLTLSGRVLDHDRKEGLAGATLFIINLGQGAATDAHGNYHFHHLCDGTYRIRVTYLGYETMEVEVKLKTPAVRDFNMHSDDHLLKLVEVRGQNLGKQTVQSKSTLSGRELEETKGLSLGESLKKLSGVNSLQTGPSISKPVIHGMHSNRVLILNNGVRQEGQQWGTEHAPEIDPMAASEFTVIKGAAGVRYGSDAIGGVVLAQPKPLPDTAGTSGELNLIGSTNNYMGLVSGMVQGGAKALPGLGWRLQGTLKRAGNTKAPDYYLGNTGFAEQNFSGGVAYTKARFGVEVYGSRFYTKLGILSAAHIGNLTDLYNAIDRGRPANADAVDFTYKIDRPYQDVTHHLIKTKAYWKPENFGKLELQYAFQQNIRDEFDVHRPSEDPALHLDISTQTTDLVWEHQPIGNFSGSVGVSYMYQFNRYEGRYFIPFFRSHTTGIFWLEKWRKNNLQLEAGARFDSKHLEIIKRERDDIIRPKYQFNNFSGTIGAAYDWGYHVTVSGNATSAWRAPNANELFSDGVHHGAATFEKGNPELTSEKAYNAEITLQYHTNPRLNGEISVYQNYITDFINLVPVLPATLTIRGAFPTFRYQQTDAVFRGVDLNWTYAFTDKLMLESKSSLVRARDRRRDEYLLQIPTDRTDNTLRYTFGDIGQKQKFRKAYLALGGLAVAKQTNLPEGDNIDYAPAPDGYFLLHAEAGATVMLGQQAVQFGVTGSNLLNTSYRDYLNRFRYYTDEAGRVIMFRVTVAF